MTRGCGRCEARGLSRDPRRTRGHDTRDPWSLHTQMVSLGLNINRFLLIPLIVPTIFLQLFMRTFLYQNCSAAAASS